MFCITNVRLTIILLIGIIPDNLFLPIDAVDAVGAMSSLQSCSEKLISADTNKDGQLDRAEYMNAINVYTQSKARDVFDASNEVLSENLQHVFERLCGPRDAVDIIGEGSLERTCHILESASLSTTTTTTTIPSSWARTWVGRPAVSYEYCLAAMTLSDNSNNADAMMDSNEFFNFVSLMASQDFSCITKFDDLPTALKESYIASSSNRGISILGARPTDLVSDVQSQFLSSFCIETNALVRETSIGFCGGPTSSPVSISPSTQRPTVNSLQTCFLNLTRVDNDGNEEMDQLEYINFVEALAKDDNAFQGLLFNELPIVLQNTFNDLAIGNVFIDISGSKIGSFPSIEELEFLARVCDETNDAILAWSVMSHTPNPTPLLSSTEIPTVRLPDPPGLQITESPTAGPTLASERPSMTTAEPTELLMPLSARPTQAAPIIDSREPSIQPDMVSSEPTGSLSTSIPSSGLPSRIPTQAFDEFDVSNTFVISNTVGLTALDMTPLSQERAQLDAGYEMFVQNATADSLGMDESSRRTLRMRRRLRVEYVDQSGRTQNYTDTPCPQSTIANSTCLVVDAAFSIKATAEEDLMSLLASIKSSVDAMILKGRLQTFIAEQNSNFVVVSPTEPTISPFVMPTTSPIGASAQPASLSTTSPVVPSAMTGSILNISADFVVSNDIGISAAGFIEGSQWYNDISTAFENLSLSVVSRSSTGSLYVPDSCGIVDVFDVTCPESRINAFCQSIQALFQVQRTNTTAADSSKVVNEITNAITSSINLGTLQSELDAVNPQSSYRIEEGYDATIPQISSSSNSTNGTDQSSGVDESNDDNNNSTSTSSGNGGNGTTTIVAIILGVAGGICFVGVFCFISRGSKSMRMSRKDYDTTDMDAFYDTTGPSNTATTKQSYADSLMEDDGYYEEEFQYGAATAGMARTSSGSFANVAKLSEQDQRFFQVFGGNGRVSPQEQDPATEQARPRMGQTIGASGGGFAITDRTVRVSSSYRSPIPEEKEEEEESESESSDSDSESSSESNDSTTSSSGSSRSGSSNGEGDSDDSDDSSSHSSEHGSDSDSKSYEK